MARPYFWKYVDAQIYPGVSAISGAQALMWSAGAWDNSVYTPQWNALYEQVSSGKAYDKNLYEQLIAPHSYDYWVTSPYGKTQVDQWHQSDIKAQQDAIAKQKAEQERLRAEQERLRAEQEAKAREQQAALERQRQQAAAAAEKSRKEAEFKSALDAMNQRANVKRTDEVVGEMSETPEQAAQRKKKKVGYDATKVTGILGAAPTESKKLLGM